MKPTGERAKGKNLAPLNNWCSRLDELDVAASTYPRRRKISDLKTRAERALSTWQIAYLVENTQIMVLLDDTLQP